MSRPLLPRALEGIGGVGDVLELVQDELGSDQHAFDEPGIADVRNPAVDDDARIQDFAPGVLAPPPALEHGKIAQFLAPGKAHGVSQIGEERVDEDEEEDAAFEPEQHVPEQASDHEPEDRAQESAHIGHGVVLQAFYLSDENQGERHHGDGRQDNEPDAAFHLQGGVHECPVEDHERHCNTEEPFHIVNPLS